MRKLVIAIVATLGFSSAFAQMSKDELKQVKKEMKSLTPEQYMELKNTNETLKEEVADKETTVENLQAENADLQGKLDDREATIKKFEEIKEKEQMFSKRKAKKVLVRLGFSDVVITKEENEKFNGHVDLISEVECDDCPVMASTKAYLIG